MVANLYPDLVRGVIVGDSPLDMAEFKMAIERGREWLGKWRTLAGGTHSIEEITAVVGDEYLAARLFYNDPDMIGMLLDDFDRTVKGFTMDALLPSIRCRVLLLQADPGNGGMLKDDEVKRFLPLLTQPAHKKFPGASHMFFVDQKEAVLNAILEFTSGIDGSRQNR